MNLMLLVCVSDTVFMTEYMYFLYFRTQYSPDSGFMNAYQNTKDLRAILRNKF